MDRWRPQSRDGYIFPIRNKKKLTTQTTNNGDIKHFIGRCNNWLKKIGDLIGCDFPLHCYTFRHIAITNYISKDIPVIYVANMMGTSVENCEKVYYNNQGDVASRNIVAAATCDYKKLPDFTTSAAPKVSVILGQSTSDSCHDVQLAVNNLGATSTYAVVGNLGAALACLAVAPANESIAHVASFNLSAVMTDAELGFGNLAQSDKQWSADVSFTKINTIGYVKRNKYLHQKGYIFLTNYDGLENSVFFSSDQTLTTGDYRTIARCRVMHKSRRVVRRALLPYVNSNVEVDTSTGQISSSDITTFQNLVLDALDTNMVVNFN